MSIELGRKIAYQPHETKRFHVSEDEFSRSRIRAIKEAADTLRTTLPFEIGISVYGSLSKGKELSADTKGYSDVDLSIWIDPDDLQRWKFELLKEGPFQAWYVREYLSKMADWRSERPHPGRGLSAMRKRLARTYVEHGIRAYIQSVIFGRLEASREQSGFDPGRPVPVDVNYPAETPEGLEYDVEWMTDVDEYFAAVREAEKTGGAAPRWPFEWPMDENDEAQYDGALWKLRCLFGLDVGGGLRPFQRRFVAAIAQSNGSEPAQRVWDNVRRHLLRSRADRTDGNGSGYQLPVRFEDAIVMYGVDVPIVIEDENGETEAVLTNPEPPRKTLGSKMHPWSDLKKKP